MKAGVWTGLLLVIVGLWLVMQVVVGDLPGRLLSWSGMFQDDGS